MGRISSQVLRLLLIVTVLMTFAKGKQITVEKCGKNFMVKKSRIIRGDVANQGEYPWMVSLQAGNSTMRDHMCGATILNENWIITAAHCIYKMEPEELSIYAGLDDLTKIKHKAVRFYNISKVIMHESYNPEGYVDDIALLRTSNPIDIKGSKGYINGICLPETNGDPAGWAIVSGWGHTVERGNKSDVLNKVKVPIVPRETCNNAYDLNPNDEEDVITEGMICAGIINRDSCQQDSGGPLSQRNKKGVYVLIGVVSWGEGCGRRTHPGVYTKVASYVDWIEKHVD